MIDVGDEFIQGVDALLESAFDPLPFIGSDNSRDQVEWENPFCPGGISVDIESNAHLKEKSFGRALRLKQLAVVESIDGLDEQPGFGTRHARYIEHLVIEAFGLIGIEPHASTSREFINGRRCRKRYPSLYRKLENSNRRSKNGDGEFVG